VTWTRPASVAETTIRTHRWIMSNGSEELSSRSASSRGRGLQANADTHSLSGFSLVDAEAFSFSNFANCSRT
jgi:hypothetical protein